MQSQEEQVEAAEAQAEAADDKAEFAGAWDDIAAEESGQPSLEEGRQDEPEAEAQDEAEEAGQAAESGTPDADADEASRDETPDDIWADAPEPLREAYQASEDARKRAENLVRSNGARAARAQSELHALKQAVAAQRNDGKATEEGEESADPEERYKQLREEYPEVAVPLLDRIISLEGTLNELKADRKTKIEAESQEFVEQQRTELIGQHEDFDQIVVSDDYAAWLQAQVPAIQRVCVENAQNIVNAAECAWVLDLYKRDRGLQQPNEAAEREADRRRKQLEAGTTARTRTPAVSRDTSDDFNSEWERLEKQDRQAAGRR